MTTFADMVLLAVAFVTGAVVAWALTALSSRNRRLDLETRAGGAEAVIQELRRELEERDREKAGLLRELALERGAKIEAATRREAAERSLEEERRFFADLKREMADAFSVLSSQALKSTSEDFAKLASLHLGTIVETTKGKLGEHQAALDGMIAPLRDTLKRYEEELKAMEARRLTAHGSLEEQLKVLASSSESLRRETGNLVSALRRPEVRGRWGEMQLKRVAELSGMSPHCDFTEQFSVDTERGRIRPDMVIHLPSGREIVVDSKVSLDAYLDAASDSTEEGRTAKTARHAQQVRAHMNRLSSKEYWSQFAKSPEFVVLFIPGESFLGAALDHDRLLIEDGIEKGVIIATPATFIALLKAVAFGWRQEQTAKNAMEISLLGRELYERMSVMVRHLDDLGTGIRKVTEAYNRTVGSMEARVLPSARRLKDLGVTGAGEMAGLDKVDETPRTPGDLADRPREAAE